MSSTKSDQVKISMVKRMVEFCDHPNSKNINRNFMNLLNFMSFNIRDDCFAVEDDYVHFEIFYNKINSFAEESNEKNCGQLIKRIATILGVEEDGIEIDTQRFTLTISIPLEKLI